MDEFQNWAKKMFLLLLPSITLGITISRETSFSDSSCSLMMAGWLWRPCLNLTGWFLFILLTALTFWLLQNVNFFFFFMTSWVNSLLVGNITSNLGRVSSPVSRFTLVVVLQINFDAYRLSGKKQSIDWSFKCLKWYPVKLLSLLPLSFFH